MFRRTKTKLEKKDSSPTDDDNQKSTNNDLAAGFGKFLGKKQNQESTESLELSQNGSVSVTDKTETIRDKPKHNDKISSLIRLIKSSKGKILAPKLDLSTGVFTFPQLSDIGEDPNNIQFLETLTSDSADLLEKTVYERIAVCPQHPDSLQVNVRLYCPKCNTMDIEKLHLFEHRVCGYISETKNFGFAESILECPSCKKPIKDKKRELRIPAMWYNCHSCKEKFDDVVIKMYCRQFDHDFDTNMAGTVSIPGYVLKDSQSSSDYDSSLILNIKELLQKHKFISEEDHSLKGKSGHYHNIDLIATNTNTDTVFLYVLQSDSTIDESQINSKIIQVLDCNPTKTIILGNLSDKAKSLASRYDILVIDTFEKNEVLSSLENILSDIFTTEKQVQNKQQNFSAELEQNKIFQDDDNTKTERIKVERLAERKRLEEEERLEAEKIESERLETEFEAEKQRLEEERRESEQLEAERLAERKRLEEERKKVERIEAEKLAERKKLESEILSERKKLEAEKLAERKKLEEERFADQLILKAEKQRLETERKKVEKLEFERQRLEKERKKAELLATEKLAAEEKRKEEDRKQAEKRATILKKLEETENQLKSLKSSFGSDNEKGE